MIYFLSSCIISYEAGQGESVEEVEPMSLSQEVGRKVAELRKEREMSQETLASQSGLSRSAVSQIELGNRNIKIDELSDLAGVLDVSVNELLGEKEIPDIVLPEQREKETDSSPDTRILIDEADLEKFEEVLLYVLNKVGSKANVGKTVLYKLLYFIDFDFYEKYEEQLVGATYMRNKHGPTPREFIKIVDRMKNEKKLVQVTDEYFDYEQTKYLPTEKPDLEHLSGRELEMIDEVLDRLSDMNANQLSEYSHKDVPWMTTEEGENIEYEAVFYRTPEYSVRDDVD